MSNWAIYENKANSNPKQSQFSINELRTMNNQLIKDKANRSRFLLPNRTLKMSKDIENCASSVYNEQVFKHRICMNRPWDDRRGGFAGLAVALDISLESNPEPQSILCEHSREKRKDMQ
jgi:hypothetical protein